MTDVARGRLADLSSAPEKGERIEELVRLPHVVVEQILTGELDGPAEYLQEWDEFVVVMAGAAVLEVDGERLELGAGHWALLPAGVHHRLIEADAGTSWLAVHLHGS